MKASGLVFLLTSVSLSFALFACNAEDVKSLTVAQTIAPPDSSTSDPVNPALPPAPVPTSSSRPSPTDTGTPAPAPTPTSVKKVLLFNGTGVSTSDWQSTENILKSQAMSYDLANSAQLNAMSLETLSGYGVMIVPGGSGGTIYANLTPATRLNIRQAVRDYGMGYVGFCAGAWVAVGPESDGNTTASYGFAVAKGSVLPSWFPGGNSSLVADMVDVKFTDGSVRSLVWWGGPSTPEWSNGVVARYDNGKPAISETLSGKGYVVISGPHPEAPQGWRATAGTDSDGLDFDIAVKMIRAAMSRTGLATY